MKRNTSRRSTAFRSSLIGSPLKPALVYSLASKTPVGCAAARGFCGGSETGVGFGVAVGTGAVASLGCCSLTRGRDSTGAGEVDSTLRGTAGVSTEVCFTAAFVSTDDSGFADAFGSGMTAGFESLTATVSGLTWALASGCRAVTGALLFAVAPVVAEALAFSLAEAFADSCSGFFSAGDFSDFASKPRTFISFAGACGCVLLVAVTAGFSVAFAVVSGALDSVSVFPFTWPAAAFTGSVFAGAVFESALAVA